MFCELATRHMISYYNMASFQGGGYDCQFVDPPQELQTECAICLHVVREPYLVDCCGYRFCRVCIENVDTEARKASRCLRYPKLADCPLCKKKFTTVPDKLLERTLKQKHVYCQNKDLGCKWVDELSQLEKHLNLNPNRGVSDDDRLRGCRFVQLKCSYCDDLIERRKMENHELNCPKRSITCTHCGKYTSSADDVCRHWETCPSFPVACPQGCGRACKRVGIKNHISQSCPLTHIKCKYYDIGCEAEIVRVNMPDHLEESATLHVTLLDYQCKKLKMENLSLQYQHIEEVQQLRCEMQEVQDELDEVRDENEQASAVSVLHVGNCPPTANEQKMRSLFGPHGTVHRVEWDYGTGDAYVYFTDNASVQRALEKNVIYGINLHKTKLNVYEVEPNVNE